MLKYRKECLLRVNSTITLTGTSFKAEKNQGNNKRRNLQYYQHCLTLNREEIRAWNALLPISLFASVNNNNELLFSF